MAASNYFTGEMLDRFGMSPRLVTVLIGIIFLLPGIVWFVTQKWWDTGKEEVIERVISAETDEEARTVSG
jgi:hypothetical protein